jgi:hypothetical protein
MAETPRYAHLVTLLFLGCGFVTFTCLVIALVAAAGKARMVAKFALGGAALTAIGYATVLFGVAFASSNKTLPPGNWKYFCEADCHIAYSIESVQEASTLGPEAKPIAARGQFIVVRLKTWFDEKSIAPFRGNSPLTPDPRTVKLVDDAGRYFSPASQTATSLRDSPTSLTTPLRPGESYVTTLVFDLPTDAHNPRLLISDSEPVTKLLVDHENSPLHGKIYLALGAGSLNSANASR